MAKPDELTIQEVNENLTDEDIQYAIEHFDRLEKEKLKKEGINKRRGPKPFVFITYKSKMLSLNYVFEHACKKIFPNKTYNNQVPFNTGWIQNWLTKRNYHCEWSPQKGSESRVWIFPNSPDYEIEWLSNGKPKIQEKREEEQELTRRESEQEENDEEIERQRITHTILARPEQYKFRKELIEHAGLKCAISGCKIPNIIEAAHIKPVKEGGNDKIGNGLLLRTDLHKLFDSGLIAINPEGFAVWVSEQIRNNPDYGKFHNKMPAIEPLKKISITGLEERWENRKMI